MTAPMLLGGPMNHEAFRAYIEQVLVPTLQPGEIVIVDNLPPIAAQISAPQSWTPVQP